ncbi:L,D-transpeptidase [Micromonospora sp. C28SCA-DRY-2]|uniref:L,D-transpeptidase family protein n=1 Tax=Micromonospora sp. C28SCA-DRY-2 TaxID=3059522 RepID=UPI002675915E|nr:L,D-transpeptidase [Micromonospora sp. C28SCA-DRY-2]MDO3701857.1 L,D-transpeptidase [Micromonospora sp. C28SCA-DRY-2]
MPFDRITTYRWIRRVATAVGVSALLATAGATGWALTPEPVPPPVEQAAPAEPDPTAPAPSPTPEETVPVAAPAPDDLPVVDYDPAPRGFPADPAAADPTPLTEGLHPTRRIAAYDAPGGRPLAFLAPTIRGVELTMPIAQRRAGWTAVLLPSANRRLAWLPPGGFTTVELRDQLVVERRAHRLTWYRAGRAVRSWEVSLGQRGQETPLGRTFILGRTPPPQHVYGGVDIFALGAVPDDPNSVPASLRGAHIGLHSWYHDGELGRNTTNGCIRLTRSGQRELLAEVRTGSAVVVVDQLPAPPPTA